MKSLIVFWKHVLKEFGDTCTVSTSRDSKRASDRFEHEGVSFLTITLPSYCADLQKGLSNGSVDPSHFAGFRRSEGLPLFLGGFLDRVFDRGTGRLLDEPDVDCIFALRQLTLMFGKIRLPCSDARNRGAISTFVKCELEVRNFDTSLSDEALSSFVRMSNLLMLPVLCAVDKKVHDQELVPRHGPGQTADRLRGNSKFDLRYWPARLEIEFPFGEFAIPSWKYREVLDHVDFREPRNELPVKVTLVPKTLKTPRIIAIEPTAMQYMQQALRELLEDSLKKDDLLRWFIGLDDQVPNRDMARKASRDSSLATLDLSEASDRVSNQLVRAMLSRTPSFSRGVDSTRSRKADVPGHGVIRLAKFASMGSALTFPIEAMVFTTIVFLGIEKALNRQLTLRDVKSFKGRVRVYGDDIIVPTDMADSVISALETFGLRVNRDKSYWNGKFRESCGGDYYDGTDVTPVRFRRVFPTGRDCVREISSLVAMRNQFYWLGLWSTASRLDDRIRALLRHYPIVSNRSSALGRESFIYPVGVRFHKDLQHPQVRAWKRSDPIPDSRSSGEGALVKCLLNQSHEPIMDSKHLERFGRPRAASMKLSYVSPIF